MSILLKPANDAITKIERSGKPESDECITARFRAKQEALRQRDVRYEFRRRCKRKERYDNWHEARKAAIQIKANLGSEQYPYPCQSCTGWHLTTKKPKQQSRIRKVYQWAKGEKE